MKRDDEELDFYRRQSAITRPGKHEPLYEALPAGIAGLCRIVQNLIVHAFWIQDVRNYGITAESLKSGGRSPNNEINLRSVEEKLGVLVKPGAGGLTEARPPGERVVGNCRDYSMFLVSMLRHRGIPARVRSGVARYFHPAEEGLLEDHFVCELWDEGKDRWRRVDAQIDEVQRKALGIAFDTTDLPPGQFLDAGELFHEVGAGKAEPEKTGIFEFRGWPYVRYKLVNDLACVSSVEALAWEGWGICERIFGGDLSGEDQDLLERVADLLESAGTCPGRSREAVDLFGSHPDLRLPPDHKPQYHEFPFL